MGILQAQGIVGPPAISAGDGANLTVRQDKQGALVVQENHGRYYEAAIRKNLYTANVSGQAITVVGTSMTGLILINNSSAYNLALQKWSLHVSSTSASATSIGLAWFNTLNSYGASTLTPVTAAPCFLGGGAPKAGGAYSAVNSTNGTPVEMFCLLHNTAAIATTGEDPGSIGDFEGSIIVPPGFGVCFEALGASATGHASLQWEEVPV